jgi:glutamate-1-semialdehyde 2,1-aminomutase
MRSMPDVPRSRLRRAMAEERSRFEETHTRSLALHREAARHMVVGVPMPWMLAWPGPCPVYVARGEGARLTDVDGNDYIDFCLGDTGAMTGHSPAATVRTIRKRAGDGMTFMLPTEDALEIARALTERFALTRWQFTLSATDANRHALRYARLITGRPKVLVFDGCYHGTVDECFATLSEGDVVPRPGSLGPPLAPALTTRVVAFNDVDALERALAYRDVACVLTEPALTNIGIVLPQQGFHEALREATRRAETLVVIDETHTLSAGPGGWTGLHGLRPDMLVIGKSVASGIPAAALGLSDEVAERVAARLDPARAGMGGVGGTLAANALSLAAMRATLEHVLTEDAFARSDALGQRCAAGLETIFSAHELPWHVIRIGSRVEYHFAPEPLRTGAEGAAIVDGELSGYLHLFALNRGILVFPFHNRSLISAAHTPEYIDRHNAVIEDAISALSGAR